MRIYFNRCFTQTAQVIEMLQNNDKGEKFEIFISHLKRNDYLESIANYFELEPAELSGREYATYCLEFCIKHNIDLFIPRNQVTTISEYREEFEKLGIKVMLIGTHEIYELLNDKVKTYEELQSSNIIGIPLTYKINNYSDFKKAYEEITSKGSKACMKPISGIGGDGFRRISDEISEINELYTTSESVISKDRLDRVLKSVDKIEPFMVSEYIEDEEYSIDCLSLNGELLVGVPRRKIDRYRQNIEYNEELIEIARKITKRYNLSYLYNVQVKYHLGEAYLIEVNTRMSGGIYKSCLSGVNFLYLAVKLLADKKVELPKNIKYDFQMYETISFEFNDL